MSKNVSTQYAIAAVATAGVLGGAYYAYRAYNTTKIPDKWTQVGTLKDIYIYPIKSCGAIKLARTECTVLGPKDGWTRDRIMMVVDEKNNFITARGFPELLLVQPTVKGSVLTLKHVDMEPVRVNLNEVVASKTTKIAHVWGIPVEVFDCGWEASEWFARLIDRSAMNFRLVYYAPQHGRALMKCQINKVYKYTKNDSGAFPDEAPFHLINEASVDDLNTRLEDKLTHRNFRPNFVLTGAEAYAEDNWKFVKIGENVFEILQPCARCVVTTIEPETGVRSAKSEPLETLKTYRQVEDPAERKIVGSSPRMGIQMALRSGPGGLVSQDEAIYVA